MLPLGAAHVQDVAGVIYATSMPARDSAVPSTVGRLGVDGFWVRDYGGGVRVGRPVGAR